MNIPDGLIVCLSCQQDGGAEDCTAPCSCKGLLDAVASVEARWNERHRRYAYGIAEALSQHRKRTASGEPARSDALEIRHWIAKAKRAVGTLREIQRSLKTCDRHAVSVGDVVKEIESLMDGIDV